MVVQNCTHKQHTLCPQMQKDTFLAVNSEFELSQLEVGFTKHAQYLRCRWQHQYTYLCSSNFSQLSQNAFGSMRRSKLQKRVQG